MKIKYFLIAAIASYVLFLLIYIPASTVIAAFKENIPQIKIEGITGSIWNGQAKRITYINKHTLNDANWSICIWRLITGEACVELNATYNNHDLHSEIGINLAGTLKARDLKLSLDAERLGTQLDLPLGQLAGNIFLDIEYLEWANDSTPTAEGIVKWNNAAIIFAEETPLGTVSIHLSESDQYPLSATISNSGGSMAINGHTNISDDGEYSLELRLLLNDNASTNLRKNIGVFTKKQSDGSYIIEYSGNINQPGIFQE